MNNAVFHDLILNDNLKIPNTILIHRRKQLKLTQKEVAKHAGIAHTTYQRFEDGTRDFTNCCAATFMAVCFTLALDPYEFFKNNYGNGDSNGK